MNSFKTGAVRGTKQHSRSFIQHVDIVWMYLHWRFLNGYWGKYLKCRKYVHSGQAQTYQDSSKPLWGLGWVVLHLSTSTSLCRSTGLAEDCWGLFFQLYLITLRVFFSYSCMYSSIYYESLMFILLFCCWVYAQWSKLFVSAICQECCYSIIGFVETMYILF